MLIVFCFNHLQKYMGRAGIWGSIARLLTMVSEPPAVAMRLCLGQCVAPYSESVMDDQEGNIHKVPLVDCSRSNYEVFRWLWAPLGVSLADWRAGKPYQLPLVQEIEACIAEVRCKRKRDGTFYDREGRVNSKCMVLSLRGRDLQAMSDPRKLLLNLVSPDSLAWFVQELWRELQAVPVEDKLPLAGEVVPVEDKLPLANEVATDVEPFSDSILPGEAPGDAADVTVEAAEVPAEAAEHMDFEQHIAAELKKAVEDLRRVPAIKKACWDKSNGRFQVWAHGVARPMYAPVKKFKTMVKNLDRGAVAEAIAGAAAHAKASL